MKKKMILFLVLMLLFLMLLTNYSQGQEKEQEVACYIKGNDYLKLAEEYKIFYVMGLIDMLWNQTWFYSSEDYSDLNKATNGMTAGQIRAIFDKYLEKHPEKWHLIASSLFWTAIMEIVGENKLN